ncbi:MAG: TIGR02453 family protein [Gemmatimonadaceae bacterium]
MGAKKSPAKKSSAKRSSAKKVSTRSAAPTKSAAKLPAQKAATKSATTSSNKGVAVVAAAKKAVKRAMSVPESFEGFRPAAMTFLRGLKKNNRKEWFEEHRDDYEREIKGPLLALIEDVDVRLAEFAPEIIGSPKKSMFRIYRDVRFSKDKSPYKTHAAAWFYHRDGGSSVGSEAAHGGAGFYVHIAPEGTFLGGGIWMPPRPVLNRIRQNIADDHEGFEDIVLSPAFKKRFGALEKESVLSRPPRGFAPDHPAGDWLRYQSFTAGRELTAEEYLSPKLPAILAKHYEAMTPFIRWLNEASGLKPSTMR